MTEINTEIEPYKNIYRYSGIQSLPDGSIVEDDGVNRPRIVGRWIRQVAQDLNLDSDRMFSSYPEEQFITGALIRGMVVEDEDWFKVADRLAVLAPNLSWLRCGRLSIVNYHPILDYYDGLLGVNPIKFARGKANPVIFRLAWKDILEAYKKSVVSLTTHHEYDMVIQPGSHQRNDPVFDSWIAEKLEAYKI